MKQILKDIQTGAFTSEWIREYKAGMPKFKAIRRNNDAQPIEEVGANAPRHDAVDRRQQAGGQGAELAPPQPESCASIVRWREPIRAARQPRAGFGAC